jgi:hypothetical protein
VMESRGYADDEFLPSDSEDAVCLFTVAVHENGAIFFCADRE